MKAPTWRFSFGLNNLGSSRLTLARLLERSRSPAMASTPSTASTAPFFRVPWRARWWFPWPVWGLCEPLSRQQAARVLNVHPFLAGRRGIERAYKQLMKKNHPDVAGSSYLASVVTSAKNRLLSAALQDGV